MYRERSRLDREYKTALDLLSHNEFDEVRSRIATFFREESGRVEFVMAVDTLTPLYHQLEQRVAEHEEHVELTSRTPLSSTWTLYAGVGVTPNPLTVEPDWVLRYSGPVGGNLGEWLNLTLSEPVPLENHVEFNSGISYALTPELSVGVNGGFTSFKQDYSTEYLDGTYSTLIASGEVQRLSLELMGQYRFLRYWRASNFVEGGVGLTWVKVGEISVERSEVQYAPIAGTQSLGYSLSGALGTDIVFSKEIPVGFNLTVGFLSNSVSQPRGSHTALFVKARLLYVL